MEKEIKPEKFKPYWVVSINGWLCGASYSKAVLKNMAGPSFRKLTFIRSEDELKYFTKRTEITNVDLVKQCLDRELEEAKTEG